MYEGQWLDDRIHGKGVALFASGNRYEGKTAFPTKPALFFLGSFV